MRADQVLFVQHQRGREGALAPRSWSVVRDCLGPPAPPGADVEACVLPQALRGVPSHRSCSRRPRSGAPAPPRCPVSPGQTVAGERHYRCSPLGLVGGTAPPPRARERARANLRRTRRSRKFIARLTSISSAPARPAWVHDRSVRRVPVPRSATDSERIRCCQGVFGLADHCGTHRVGGVPAQPARPAGRGERGRANPSDRHRCSLLGAGRQHGRRPVAGQRGIRHPLARGKKPRAVPALPS